MSQATGRQGRPPPVGKDQRLASRVSDLERNPEPWRTVQGGDRGTMRIVRGTFNTTTPSITLGAGYTLTRSGVGNIQITFTVPFKDPPSVVANADAGGGLSCFVRTVGTPTTTTAQIQVITTSGTAQDSAVNFIAVGLAS